ncbi:MAG: BlaI/MecI/CopY family transcriptional regulator [Oscillospiraceae bacterium]|nr:BlaI/MecI/CopY family transcriptional regulator [Oscillospiraceae bacterium]
METPKIFESEYRFCLILWEHEPISSTVLVGLCKERLGWSKATTYTVIRRLSERGVLKNENTIVTSLISKEQAQAAELEEMVEKTFEGSMPAFIAAFSRSKKLTRQEVDQLKALIEAYEEG